MTMMMNDVVLPGVAADSLFQRQTQFGTKDGIRIEKGVILTEDYLNNHFDEICECWQIFSVYPDIFLDTISTSETKIKLLPYQRIFIRAVMRYKQVYVCACRAWSKSFLTILALFLQCVFVPGSKRFICAPGKSQSAQIAKEKIQEIYDNWPLLKKEVMGWEIKDTPGNFSKDTVTIKFRNGSQLDVVAPLDSTRGGRRHSGLIDEVRDHDGEALNQIVLPLLNVSRRLPTGEVNPKEPNQQTIYATSAGSKQSFAYQKLLEVFESSIIDPKHNFCMGNDYRIPVAHGLLAPDFVKTLRMSPTFNENAFAAEYGSIWTGGSEDSWFNFEKVSCHRRLKKAETKARSNTDGVNQFYVMSVDVGRLNDLTIATVFRVNVNGQGVHGSSLVYIRTLGLTAETRTFERQAIQIKQLIEDFNPKSVIIDINGIGYGLAEHMIKEQFSQGKTYPAYGFENDKDLIQIQPAQAPRILFGMKATGPLKSAVVANAYNRINQGVVQFLITEQKAKNKLMSTQKGQNMKMEERVAYLLPYENTSRLIEEIMNQRLKSGSAAGSANLTIENINSSMHDDRFMSLCYGLYRISLFEDLYRQTHRRTTKRTLVFGNI